MFCATALLSILWLNSKQWHYYQAAGANISFRRKPRTRNAVFIRTALQITYKRKTFWNQSNSTAARNLHIAFLSFVTLNLCFLSIWRRLGQVYPKPWYLTTRLHGVRTQKTQPWETQTSRTNLWEIILITRIGNLMNPNLIKIISTNIIAPYMLEGNYKTGTKLFFCWVAHPKM